MFSEAVSSLKDDLDQGLRYPFLMMGVDVIGDVALRAQLMGNPARCVRKCKMNANVEGMR